MRQQPLFLHPWQAAQLMQHMALKANDPNALPDYVAHLASGTADYEGKIRAAWEAFKKNPTEANAHKFIQYLVNVSSDLWPAVLANVLGIAQDDLSPDQLQYLKDELETHHNYLKNSLMPDVIKAIGAGTLDSLNYRTIFLYAGALWAFGSLATVMFDGLSLRDLTDIFLFAGPDDDATCDGERGCHQHVGKFYTVAEIIANGIIPGRLRCLTNCRHILIPVASPLREKEFGSNGNGNGNGVGLKHLPGMHNQLSHGRSKRNNPYATGAVVVDSYSKLAPVTGNNPHAGKGYFILADSNLLDMRSESHLQAYVDYDAAKYLGVTPKETEQAISLYDNWTSDNAMDALSKLHAKAMAAGNVRVREYAGASVNVETYNVDNASLRKLQRLYDTGKLGIAPKQAIYWSNSNGTENLHIADMTDFLDAKSIADLKQRMQFKHLPGEHDQRRHAPVTVARGSANIPKGEYESYGSAGDRWAAEKQMNKLAGVKDYKAANKAGWFTVKIGEQYHIINTKKKAGAEEPKTKTAQPKPKTQSATQPAPSGKFSHEYIDAKGKVRKILESDETLSIRPGEVADGVNVQPQNKAAAAGMARVKRTLGMLPLAHQRIIKDLLIAEGENISSLRSVEKQSRAIGDASWSARRIRIAADGDKNDASYFHDGPYSSLIHEVGHLVMDVNGVGKESGGHAMLRYDVKKKLEQIWKERAAEYDLEELPTGTFQDISASFRMKAVSRYAKTNPSEFAAEAYAYYVAKPGVLRKEDPETYAVIKELFLGQEYGTQPAPTNAFAQQQKLRQKHLPGMHDQRSHGYRFGSQASSMSYLRQRRRDLTPEQWADYVQRARNKRDELLKKAPIRAKMLKDEQYAEEGKDANGCEYRIYMTTRKWWRNDITADQFSPDDERNRIKATIDNVRSILKDDPDFVKAIDYDGELMVRQANRRVGVHAVFTRQQDDFGMGSGGPGGAKVFYGPYDEIHRNAGLQKYMGTISLGVDPIYVTVHELHHAFHSSSEFDEFSDAVTLDTHLKLGNNLMPVNVNNQLGDYVRRANYRAQGKFKHITLTSRVAIGWLYKRHKDHIDALVDESWGDRAGEVKAKLVQWSKIKPKPWRDEEYGYAEKHLPGEHDQRKHTPVTVTRGAKYIPKGRYNSLGEHFSRWTAETQMLKLADVKNYKEANTLGYHVVKIGGTYHIINVMDTDVEPEPPPEPKHQVVYQEPPANLPAEKRIRPFKAYGGVAKLEGNGTESENQEVAEALTELPQHMQEMLYHVNVVDDIDLSGTAGAEFVGVGGVSIALLHGMTVAAGGTGLGILTKFNALHEAGHIIASEVLHVGEPDEDSTRRRSLSRELRAEWQRRADKIGHVSLGTGKHTSWAIEKAMGTVSNYAATSPSEYIAENFAFYVRKPSVLKKKDPEAYNILKDMFDGQEYIGAEVDVTIKHLPGEHDQQRHDPHKYAEHHDAMRRLSNSIKRYGLSNGAFTTGYIGQAKTEALIKAGLAEPIDTTVPLSRTNIRLTQAGREAMSEAMTAEPKPATARKPKQPAKTYTFDELIKRNDLSVQAAEQLIGSLPGTKGVAIQHQADLGMSKSGARIAGLYQDGTIILGKQSSGRTIVHEAGHYVYDFAVNDYAARDAIRAAHASVRKMDYDQLLEIGYREHSQENAHEFFSDSYAMYFAGGEAGRTMLRTNFPEIANIMEGLK